MSRCFNVFVAILFIAGCTTTKQSFYENPSSAGVVELCRTYLNTPDVGFKRDISSELLRRGIYSTHCQAKVEKQDAQVVAGLAAVALVGAAVAACSGGGCGGGGYSSPNRYGGTDWDQFYDQYGYLTWRCREVQTGRFADDYRCAGKYKSDTRWPGKIAI
jgi:hypothetical protein